MHVIVTWSWQGSHGVSCALHRQRTDFAAGDCTMMHWSSLGVVQVGVVFGGGAGRCGLRGWCR